MLSARPFILEDNLFFIQEMADRLRAEFEQEKKRAVNVATRSLERDLGKQ